jgi:hypothetical protein
MSQSRSILALIAALVCLAAAVPSRFLAQGDGRKAGAAHVFRGGGGDRSTLGRKPPPAPVSLSLDTIKNLIGGEPGAIFVKLTPKDPSVVNRGALVFAGPTLVEGGENYATWGPSSTNLALFGSEGHLALWLRPATGKKYLIDCSVQSGSEGALFSITGPSSTAPMQVAGVAGGQHLTFVLDATDNQWQGFQIRGVGSKNKYGVGTKMEWTFYSCEVTNL